MKTCPKCKEEKSKEEFSKDKCAKDGLCHACKSCDSARFSRRYFKNRDRHLKEYRKNKEKHQARSAAWRAKNPDYAMKVKEENPVRYKAWKLVGYAIRKGTLIREPCLVCSAENTDAHHDDYKKPLEVIWLCRIHHMERHRDQRQRL